MHVLYFHQYFTTPNMSGGTRSYEMAKMLIERGHEVTMVCARQDKMDLGLACTAQNGVRTGMIEGIRMIQFDLQYSNYLSPYKRTWIFLRFALSSVGLAFRTDYDLLLASSTPLSVAIPGILASYLRLKPFVFEVRDLWPELLWAIGAIKNPLVLAAMSLLERMSYRAASACIALAPGIQSGIARRSPKRRLIAMIPNGCDLELFRPGKRENLDLPGVRATDCVAVFTGAHGIANGLEAVLDAAKILLRRGRKDIIFALIGDGKMKPTLQSRAQHEDLENCLFFEPLPKNQLASIVSSCDIGLMILADVPAFYYGTSPNKFFDYISSGLPVINNYPGWLSDLIREHHCGEAVPPRNSEALADALCKLADDKELRREYGHNARTLAETQFARERLSTQFVDYLEVVMNRYKKRLFESGTA